MPCHHFLQACLKVCTLRVPRNAHHHSEHIQATSETAPLGFLLNQSQCSQKQSVSPRLGSAEATTAALKFLLACILLCGKSSTLLMTYANKQCSIAETMWYQNQPGRDVSTVKQDSPAVTLSPPGLRMAGTSTSSLAPFSIFPSFLMSCLLSLLKSSKLKWHLPVIRHFVRSTKFHFI